MNPNKEISIFQEVIKYLSLHLDIPPKDIEMTFKEGQTDAVIKAEEFLFLVEYKSINNSSQILHAIRQLSDATQFGIPLVVVPFMGSNGKNLCTEYEISWMDLSGNADISGKGLKIRISGEKNKFIKKGRPKSAFSPNGSRIAHLLLLNPEKEFTHSEIVAKTKIDKGYATRVIKKLVDLSLIKLDKSGKIIVQDRELLLMSWQEDYSLLKHDIYYGHISARTGNSLVEKLNYECQKYGLKYCFTGLSAAWLYNHHSMFRTATLYLEYLDTQLITSLGFREEKRGANTWIIIPKDQGVFLGVKEVNGFPCASKFLTYLDLKDHPERSKETSIELKKQLFDECDNAI